MKRVNELLKWLLIKRCGNWKDVLATRLVRAKVCYLKGCVIEKMCYWSKGYMLFYNKCVLLHVKGELFLKGVLTKNFTTPLN